MRKYKPRKASRCYGWPSKPASFCIVLSSALTSDWHTCLARPLRLSDPMTSRHLRATLAQWRGDGALKWMREVEWI
jgi:hypothetical protein